MARDVTVASAVTSTALEAGSARRAGAAARTLEMVKRRKYPRLGVHPIAIEAHGRLGMGSQDFLKKVGRCLPTHLRPGYMARLLQDISCSLQRSNARLIQRAILP